MKKVTLFITLLTFGLLLTAGFSVFNVENKDQLNQAKGIVIDIPDDVQSVINKSCFNCHNSDSRNQKGKLNLKFDYFEAGEYSAGKLVSKLNKIIESIDEGSMPPKKFKEKYPDKMMNDDEAKLLRAWAEKNMQKLIEE